MSINTPLPFTVLLEGVNQVGKTTIAHKFKEAYGNIEIIKFPYYPHILGDINALWQIASLSKGDIIPPFFIKQVHMLFDYDFRLFFDNFVFKADKIYFLDRYYVSNLVYSRMHGIEYPPEMRSGHVKPSAVIYMRATDREKYMEHHRAFDEKMQKIYDEIYGREKFTSRLSPEMLYDAGQDIYEMEMSKLVGDGILDNFVTVDALKDTTFRAIERALQTNGIL